MKLKMLPAVPGRNEQPDGVQRPDLARFVQRVLAGAVVMLLVAVTVEQERNDLEIAPQACDHQRGVPVLILQP